MFKDNENEINNISDDSGSYKEEIRYYKKEKSSSTIKNTVKSGVSFGSCLAMIISYTAWKSIPWAIIHGIFSWLYVIYYAFKYA
ncbi:hypothetical protein [Clostridium mediterraneense]|uniref:hypothetical protein n=1 Tax=Clostridium mediterraneense TaxID=1805472 RepID=UPI00311A9890